MGYPDTASRDGQKGSFGMRWTEFSAYLMDDFRATPNVTLNLWPALRSLYSVR